ncbi:MAG: T9SS type A sorting domain-containing protein, partial [Phaeodactylibacter sp.]|nr:T9SS type A sorting domain-containing protein [Phaeodactylibacter sp.]
NECDVIVNVDDKLPPVINCPPDQVIDCQDYYWDLSIYGYPTVTDNCGYTLSSDSLVTLSQCGVGTIKRTFTAIDPAGNGATCMQILSVENLTPYDGSTIGWPQDYEIDNACIESSELDPDDLPVPYGYPDLPSENCALLAYNYTDQVFNISYPACYKIIRTWSVMDWCVFDPDNPTAGGLWTHTQIIKANDFIMPELTVPSDTTFGVDGNCEFGYVHLPLATATDCAPNVSITNNSPYATSNGADASGYYPLGTTVVTYTAIDGCGNAKTGSVVITVIDNKRPTVICDSGISTDVNEMGGGQIFVMVPAELFIAEATDNCTNSEDLEIYIAIADGDISGPPSTTELQFFCEDVGSYMVEIWVVDEAGNADFCITNLHVQDNFNLCPDMLTASIAGLIETEMGMVPGDVEVSISSAVESPMDVQTGSSFHFTELQQGGDYTVSASFNEGTSNGVTTYDLVLITRHILGVGLLNSPYKLIAADANGSGSITTLDLVYIQKVILNILDEFPNVPSWRFVDASWEFTDPSNPFYDNFPEVLNFNNLNGDELNANFVAIKVGDVNLTATNANDPNLQTNTDRQDLVFELLDEYVPPGSNFTIDFLSKDFQSIAAFQFTMAFDQNDVTLEGIEACALPNLGVSNFGTQGLDQGRITGTWYYHQGVQLRNGVCLFSFTISSEKGGYLSELIRFEQTPTDLVAYRENGTEMDIVLNFVEVPGKSAILYQNKPNPFSESTEIRFYLPKAEQGRLSVFDMTGKALLVEERIFSAGENSIILNSSVLREEGMYYYQLETTSFNDVKKMMYSR